MIRPSLTLVLLVALGCVARAPSASAPRLLRPVGAARYRISVESDEGRGSRRAVAEATVHTRSDGTDLVELESAWIGPAEGDGDAVQLAPEVRAAFGGDDTVLGRFVVGPDFDPGTVVPAGAPEPLLGLVFDLANTLLAQSAEFGVQHLVRAGDVHAFGGFEAHWRHPPSLLDARIACPGGTLTLSSLAADEAIVRWAPEPMAIALVRQNPSGPRILLDGVEDIVLEVAVDPRTGRLLRARSARDVLDLTLVLGWTDETVPAPASEPRRTGMTLRIERSIELVALGPER